MRGGVPVSIAPLITACEQKESIEIGRAGCFRYSVFSRKFSPEARDRWGNRDTCQSNSRLANHLNRNGKTIMGANPAGVRKRKKAKITRKIAETIARKQDQKAGDKKAS